MRIHTHRIRYKPIKPLLSLADVPKEQRLQAVRAAVLLLPNENREALQTLLCFLSDVTANVDENQMTCTNLAVCLAPSLFHLNTLRRESSSPRCVCTSVNTLHVDPLISLIAHRLRCYRIWYAATSDPNTAQLFALELG